MRNKPVGVVAVRELLTRIWPKRVVYRALVSLRAPLADRITKESAKTAAKCCCRCARYTARVPHPACSAAHWRCGASRRVAPSPSLGGAAARRSPCHSRLLAPLVNDALLDTRRTCSFSLLRCSMKVSHVSSRSSSSRSGSGSSINHPLYSHQSCRTASDGGVRNGRGESTMIQQPSRRSHMAFCGGRPRGCGINPSLARAATRGRIRCAVPRCRY